MSNREKQFKDFAKRGGTDSMKINVLYLGKISCKRDNLVKCGDENQMIQSPVNAILISHPKIGNILYDTGNSPDYGQKYPASLF